MRPLLFLFSLVVISKAAQAQSQTVELYELVTKLMFDSTGYENVGDWAVGRPKKYPVKWKADKLEMSNDTSINFYRQGTANIIVNGKSFSNTTRPLTWNVLLKGPRMGYASFSIVSAGSAALSPRLVLDSLLGKRPYKATLLRSCDKDPLTGYYYYLLKVPKKDPAYVKISWLTINGATALRLDGYDSWSQYQAKLACKN